MKLRKDGAPGFHAGNSSPKIVIGWTKT